MRPVAELDLLFALQTSEGVHKVYELESARARDDDAARFLVAVRPYKQSFIVAAQYRAIDALHGGRLRNVLFFDDEHPPPVVQRARAVSLSVQEREAAAFRHVVLVGDVEGRPALLPLGPAVAKLLDDPTLLARTGCSSMPSSNGFSCARAATRGRS